MILSCQNLSVAFGDEVLFQEVSFFVREQEKVAIVGNNGCGKTTLLKLIVGELSPGEGSVILQKDATVGYLAQYQNVAFDEKIYDHVLHSNAKIMDAEKELRQMEEKLKTIDASKMEDFLNLYQEKSRVFELMGGTTYRSEVTGVLKGLGFTEEEFAKHFKDLSGGQKTRVNLAGLLLKKPDLLILDEPINHLDLSAIEWLEGFLSAYKGAVLIVAHDRYFLDHIADSIVDMDQKTAHAYKGNYTAYVRQKREILLTRQREYENQKKQIDHQKEVIDKLKQFNREKSVKRARSREKLLDKMDVLDKPVADDAAMKMSLEPDEKSGKDVLSVQNLKKSFDGQSLFSDLSFQLQRGEHVALIGDNGTGKTTILKILNNKIPADGGEFTFGANVKIAYYDQEQQELSGEKTLFEELSDAYPSLTETKIRNVLAAFLFTGEDAYKKISALSGGERGRVSLAKLMLSGANLLILDEPTNHLDMTSKDILEAALSVYTGTVLFVSHDRYFINRVAHRILELKGNSLFSYLGNYDYYMEKKKEAFFKASETAEASIEEDKSQSKKDWEEQKREAAQKKKNESDIKKTEEKIEELEEKIAAIDAMFLDEEVAKNSAKLNDLTAEQNALKAQLDDCYEKWESLLII